MARKQERDPYAVACGGRLKILRAVLGYESTRSLAKAFNVPESRVNKWENGASLVSAQFLGVMEDAHGKQPLTQYVYRDDARYLTRDLSDRLAEAERRAAETA